METRKLIRLGNSSFAVSLPKKWLETNKLKKGDIVFFENSNGNLVVTSKERSDNFVEKSGEVKVGSKSEDALVAEISTLYINNFNFITLEDIDSKSKLKSLKKILDNFMGLEIVEQNNSKVVLKDTLGIEMISVNEIIRRMDNIVRSMFEDLVEVVDKDKIQTKLLISIADTDKDVNKLYFLIWKLIRRGLSDEREAKILGSDSIGLSSLQWLAMNLECIGDEIKRIARFLKEEKLEKDKKESIKNLFAEVKKNYEDAMTSYYKNDKELALGVAFENDKVTIEKINKFSKSESSNIARITERLKTIQGAIHYITRGVSY